MAVRMTANPFGEIVVSWRKQVMGSSLAQSKRVMVDYSSFWFIFFDLSI
jgi:uncharacterized protein VirK/YbjX